MRGRIDRVHSGSDYLLLTNSGGQSVSYPSVMPAFSHGHKPAASHCLRSHLQPPANLQPLRITSLNSLRWMERDTYASAHSVSGSTRADCKFPPCGMLRFSLLKRRTLAEILVRNFTPSRKFEKTPWGWRGRGDTGRDTAMPELENLPPSHSGTGRAEDELLEVRERELFLCLRRVGR